MVQYTRAEVEDAIDSLSKDVSLSKRLYLRTGSKSFAEEVEKYGERMEKLSSLLTEFPEQQEFNI